MSKDVQKPGSDNWEKSETGGRFIRDVVIVAAVLAGAFGWYYKTSQNKAAADKTAKVAKDLLLKDDPVAYAQAETKLKEVLSNFDASHGYSLAALAELNAILYVEHNVEDRKAAASDYVAKAVAAKTSTAEEYAAKAMMLVADGKAAEAEKFLTAEVIDKNAGGARIYAALGEALRVQGKLEESRRAFKAAFDADWRNPRFATLIGESYLEEGDAANALAYYSKGLQSNSEHLGSMIGAARARIANRQGLKEAGDAIKAALEREADMTPNLKARALVARAELEFFEQKFDEAIATAQSAAQTDPSFAWSFAVSARAQAAKNDAAAAAAVGGASRAAVTATTTLRARSSRQASMWRSRSPTSRSTRSRRTTSTSTSTATPSASPARSRTPSPSTSSASRRTRSTASSTSPRARSSASRRSTTRPRRPSRRRRSRRSSTPSSTSRRRCSASPRRSTSRACRSTRRRSASGARRRSRASS